MEGFAGIDWASAEHALCVVDGAGGKDKVRGLGGADLICGGKGVDSLGGGPGRDEVKQ